MKEEGNYKIDENKEAHCSASATKAGITEVSLKCHPVLRPTLQLAARKEPGLVTRWGGWSKRGMTVQTTQR